MNFLFFIFICCLCKITLSQTINHVPLTSFLPNPRPAARAALFSVVIATKAAGATVRHQSTAATTCAGSGRSHIHGVPVATFVERAAARAAATTTAAAAAAIVVVGARGEEFGTGGNLVEEPLRGEPGGLVLHAGQLARAGTLAARQPVLGWDGMGWDGMGWDGMGWDGMGWDGMGWDGLVDGSVGRMDN